MVRLGEGGTVRRREEVHRLQDAGQLASTDVEVTRRGGADGEDDGVVAVHEIGAGDGSLALAPDIGAGPEAGALGGHLRQAPVEVVLLHLELGDAVAEQATDGVGALVHRDGVAGTRELLRRGEPGRP